MEYKLHSSGQIEKRRGKGFLKLFCDTDGYVKISVTDKNQKTWNFMLHRLLYETFIGGIPEGFTVDHIDNDRNNNSLDNLQLLTGVQNVVKGNARNWRATSPEGEVFHVYNLRAFCRAMGLHRSHMYDVASGKLKQYKGWSCQNEP